MNDIDKAIQRIKQFADFCVCATEVHPYIDDDGDSEKAQTDCANDIYAILDEINRLKNK